MDSFEFFPAQSNLKKGFAFGAFYLLLTLFLWRGADFSPVGSPGLGKAMIVGFALLGGHEVFRSLRGLLSPAPCFAGDGEGFSVKGGRRWRWDELVDVRIRRVRMGPILAGTWVTIRVKKNGRGLARRVEIPWPLLPAKANETAAAILQAALLAGWRPKDKRAERSVAKFRHALAAR